MTTPSARELFYARYAEHFARGTDGATPVPARRSDVLERVRGFLASKVPDDFARGSRDRRRGTGSYRKTKARVAQMLFAQAKL